jgi:hypothetical protein
MPIPVCPQPDRLRFLCESVRHNIGHIYAATASGHIVAALNETEAAIKSLNQIKTIIDKM